MRPDVDERLIEIGENLAISSKARVIGSQFDAISTIPSMSFWHKRKGK
jgi:hypothetical protein